ncbi:MAG: undecaprenyl-phosphate glucose phosphotransferase [Rikenellaceae bacterium]
MSQVEKTNKTISLTVVAIDLIVINIYFLLFELFWQNTFHESMFWGNIYIINTLLSISYIVGLYFSDIVLYHRRVRMDQVALMSLKNMVAFFVVWLALSSIAAPSVNLSEPFIYFFIFATFGIISLRLIIRSLILWYRKKGYNQCDVLFLGSAANMQELYNEMAMMLTTGYRVLGYFDSEPNSDFDDKCKYLGRNEDALEYLSTHKVDRVYSGLPSVFGKDVIVPVINYCESNMVRFYSIPNLRNYFHRRVTLEMFSNVPMLSIHPEPLNLVVNRALKRVFDIIFSSLFLCTAFPFIYLIVGIITKITSPGPIFFKQKRHGLDGKEFWCYKFRSMKVNKDSDSVQATKHDPRKTKFGDFMRRTSIDELPQFINVFKGDMSVVGPRPHMLKHTEEYSRIIGTYMVRHYIRPGITGWAQVTGFRGETKELSDMQGRVKADIWYLEHWTMMLDLYIIYKTVANIVGRKDKTAY